MPVPQNCSVSSIYPTHWQNVSSVSEHLAQMKEDIFLLLSILFLIFLARDNGYVPADFDFARDTMGSYKVGVTEFHRIIE